MWYCPLAGRPCAEGPYQPLLPAVGTWEPAPFVFWIILVCGTLTSFGFSRRSRETSMESWEMRESIWGKDEVEELEEGGGRGAAVGRR